MVNIVVDQSLSNSSLYEHRCLKNIKKLYKSARKCDDQHQYKAIIEAAMVSTTGRFTENSQMSPGPSATVKNPSARKSLHIFTEVFYVKRKAFCPPGRCF